MKIKDKELLVLEGLRNMRDNLDSLCALGGLCLLNKWHNDAKVKLSVSRYLIVRKPLWAYITSVYYNGYWWKSKSVEPRKRFLDRRIKRLERQLKV